MKMIDCVQSLFFVRSLFLFSFSSVSHAREWASKPRDARNEGGSPRRNCLSGLAPSVTRVCILARFVRRTLRKKRLLVVYENEGEESTMQPRSQRLSFPRP